MNPRWAIVLGISVTILVIGQGLPYWAVRASDGAHSIYLPLVMRPDPWGPLDPRPTSDLPDWRLTPTPTLDELAQHARMHEADFITLVNEARAAHGHPQPVTHVACLEAAARRHARDVAADPDVRYWYGHLGSDGSWPDTRAIAAGCPVTHTYTEVMSHSWSARGALHRFAASPPHWRNLLTFGEFIGVAFEPAVFNGVNRYIVVAILADESVWEDVHRHRLADADADHPLSDLDQTVDADAVADAHAVGDAHAIEHPDLHAHADSDAHAVGDAHANAIAPGAPARCIAWHGRGQQCCARGGNALDSGTAAAMTGPNARILVSLFPSYPLPCGEHPAPNAPCFAPLGCVKRPEPYSQQRF